MHYCAVYLTSLVFLWNYFSPVNSNALLNPTSRGMMWTRNSFNSAGYNYMEINCGGVHRLKQSNGKCGLCGDPFNGPREHEKGGKYATGAIAQVLNKGEKEINVKVMLNVDLGGYFEFRLCASNGSTETQECFDQNLLKITEGRWQGDEFAYIVEQHGIIQLTLEIPERLSCEKCVLQWKYVTGNTFGWDVTGKGCLGCGIQDTYINCADITIRGWETPPTPPPPTTPIPTTMAWTSTPSPPTTSKPAPPPSPAFFVSQRKPDNQATDGQTPRFVTRQRQTVTDFDEGSRMRNGNGNSGYSKSYNPVPAPLPQTPAVILPSAVLSVPVAAAPVQSEVVDPKPVITNAPLPTTTPKAAEPPQVPGRINIPRPPKLSSEQIFALHNSKNVVSQHDPLQKVIQVGSSKIIAGADYTTVKALQMPTPPPPVNNPWKPRPTDSTVQVSTRSIPARQIGRHIQGGVPYGTNTFNNDVLGASQNTFFVPPKTNFDVFGSFGNEMLGGAGGGSVPVGGSGLINEYGSDINPRQQQASVPGRVDFRSGGVYQDPLQRNNINNLNNFDGRATDVAFLQQQNNRETMYQQNQRGLGVRQDQTAPGPFGNRHYSFNEFSSKVTENRNELLPLKQMTGTQNVMSGTFRKEEFGIAQSRHSPDVQMFGNINNVNNPPFGSNSRYGTFQDASQSFNQRNYQVENIGQNLNQRYPDNIALNSRSTKLPVVDTSTHRNANNNNVVQWRKTPPPQQEKPKTDLSNVPVNLFKGEDKRSFKAPVIKERLTNFQIGGGKAEKLSEGIQGVSGQQNSNPEQGPDSQSFRNVHLNARIHSPENYFGQDHYIAHSAEMSHPAFGGANAEIVYNSGNNNLKIPINAMSGHNNNQASALSQNYFPKTNNVFAQQPNSFESQQGLFYPKPTVPTTISSTTTQSQQQTTNQMDLQMQEIKKLREKLEQLQQLITVSKEETAKVSTLDQPGPTMSQISQTSSPNQQFVKAWQPQGIMHQQDMSPAGNNKQETVALGISSHLDRSHIETYPQHIQVTTAPEIDKPNSHIEIFKAQMLQSIQAANSRRHQQGHSETQQQSELRNRKTTPYPDRQWDSIPVQYDTAAGANTANIQVQEFQSEANPVDTQSPSKNENYRQLLELFLARKKQKQEAERLNNQRQANQNNNIATPKNELNTMRHSRTTRQSTSVRPVETIQPPTTMERIEADAATPDINSLVDKVAIGMAKKIQSGNTALQNAAPLQSNVMSALRKIALSVLKERQSNAIPDITLSSQASAAKAVQKPPQSYLEQKLESSLALEKPAVREMVDRNSIIKQKVINIKDLTPLKPESIPDSQTTDAPVAVTDSNSVPISTEMQLAAYKRRQELIRKMKMLMKMRSSSHVSDTETQKTDRPVHLPNARPSVGESAKIRPTHIKDHPNNRRPTIYDHTPAIQANAREILTRPLMTTKQALKPIATASYTDLGLSENAKLPVETSRRLRLPPDIEKSVSQRANEVEARQNIDSVPVQAADITNNDIMTQQSKRELLLKLLQSMSKKQSSSNGR